MDGNDALLNLYLVVKNSTNNPFQYILAANEIKAKALLNVIKVTPYKENNNIEDSNNMDPNAYSFICISNAKITLYNTNHLINLEFSIKGKKISISALENKEQIIPFNRLSSK